jgi:hypothetical protein
MTSQLQKFRDAKAAVSQALTDCAVVLRDAFAEASKSLFDSHPILKSIQWTQYTPYFNDGDTCEFSAHTDYPEIEFVDGEQADDYYDVDRRDERGDGTHSERDAAMLAAREFLGVFGDEDYETLFGDHVTVTVTRGAEKPLVTVEEYEHD